MVRNTSSPEHRQRPQQLAFDDAACVLRQAQAHGLVDEDDTGLMFYDFDILSARVQEMQAAFPTNALHAVAIKANPLVKVLAACVDMGTGMEAASLPELHLALAAGATAEQIVFDSPAKTPRELRFALAHGVTLNADNFSELARLDDLFKTWPASKPKPDVGLRINPQVGAGSIAATSVAETFSKFGVPLAEEHNIMRAYRRYPWLTGIHVHMGSQGTPMHMLVLGIERIFALVKRIEAERNGQPLVNFDMGGGLPAVYRPEDPAISMHTYTQAIRERMPQLFQSPYRLHTEFGRWIHANAAWAISRVEYSKATGAKTTLLTHLGADMFLRKCYDYNSWHHDIAAVDATGRLRAGRRYRYDIAGPLCFAADIIGYDVALPKVEAGDYLLIRDVGAYTYGMWSRYNSRPLPKVIGYRRQGNAYTMSILRDRETSADLVKFWGGDNPK